MLLCFFSSLTGTIPCYPDLSKHNNYLAEGMTPAIYKKLADLHTLSGYSVDECMQTGVDNPGHPFIKTVGLVAGDEECLSISSVTFLIRLLVRGTTAIPPTPSTVTDINPDHLVGGDDLDPKYVLSSRVRTGRSIRGYALPPHTARGLNDRDVEKVCIDALATLDGPLKGTYFPLKGMTILNSRTNSLQIISYSISPFLLCLCQLAWPVIGLMHVGSGTTPIRTFWFGLMRKIILGLFPWKQVAT